MRNLIKTRPKNGTLGHGKLTGLKDSSSSADFKKIEKLITVPAQELIKPEAVAGSVIEPVVEKRPTFDDSAMLSQRYELKYRVPESHAIAIRSYISNYLEQDPYMAKSPTGKYTICSLYFDSQRLNLFNETLLDKCNRYKLRIRGYDDNPNSPIFFEIKRKLNRIVYKSRARFDKNQMVPILNGQIPAGLSKKDDSAVRQFVHFTNSLSATPKCLIRYQREAFQCQSKSKIRVTFDRELSYCRTDEPVFRVGGDGWKKLPIDFVVLEIKFTDKYPIWLHDMVRLFNLNRQSMSKYCSSIQHAIKWGHLNPNSSPVQFVG